jgi:hypothetical protein
MIAYALSLLLGLAAAPDAPSFSRYLVDNSGRPLTGKQFVRFEFYQSSSLTPTSSPEFSYPYQADGSVELVASNGWVRVVFPDAVAVRVNATGAYWIRIGVRINGVYYYSNNLESFGLALSALDGVPIGGVLPVALKADEVARLSPRWLPADGRLVEDKNSPLSGRRLPDLRGATVFGADPSDNASQADRAGTTDLSLSGQAIRVESKQFENAAEAEQCSEVVGDTNAKETKCGKLQSDVSGTVKLPLPPHVKLIWIMRVR